MNIYVGNLPYRTTEDDLRNMFAEHGTVDKANVITDRETGKSKGFGFIEMPDRSAAEAAIQALNESMVGGRALRVNEAKPRENHGGGGGRRSY